MFGAIVCPKCNTARGIRIPTKTARCVKCGHSIDVMKAKVYFETDSQEELADAVRALAEKLAVDIEEPPANKKRRRRAAVKKKIAVKVRMNEEDLRAALTTLTERSPIFSRQELFEALHITNKEEQEKALEKLLASGMIFEPQPGRFKSA
jgi:hypothetical protein